MWAELSPTEQGAAAQLGWDECGWDTGDWTVQHDDQPWAELPAPAQSAAGLLGYAQGSWDAIVVGGEDGAAGRELSTAEREGIGRLVALALQDLLSISVEMAEEEVAVELDQGAI